MNMFSHISFQIMLLIENALRLSNLLFGKCSQMKKMEIYFHEKLYYAYFLFLSFDIM